MVHDFGVQLYLGAILNFVMDWLGGSAVRAARRATGQLRIVCTSVVACTLSTSVCQQPACMVPDLMELAYLGEIFKLELACGQAGIDVRRTRRAHTWKHV